MPELGEVEFFRKRWHLAAAGKKIRRVMAHGHVRLFRGIDMPAFEKALTGSTFNSSASAAKQMLFRFSGDVWLGIHLGMTGELEVKEPEHAPGKHDHLVLVTADDALLFRDPRLFGKIEFHVGNDAPRWWTKIAPPVLSKAFMVAALSQFLQRRRRTPIKAVLLMQERFPGVGNWMADEILWRAALHPKRLAGSLSPAETSALWRECRYVCRRALEVIAGRGNTLPLDLNIGIPDSWLFHHRWRSGGICPLTKKPLVREEVGGRTTCWSPARQKLR